MIGKICKARTPFYDQLSHSMKYKARPALVLGKADNDDYVVLPVSSITIKTNIDAIYDVEIDSKKYPKLNLDHTSYVRTHKQTIVHRANLRDEIGDIKSNYKELYLEILNKREMFNDSVTKQALL